MATEARRPLIAGNWKMNLNHLEAIALVQKLAFTLDHKDFERAEIIVIPPFTDIRSVQTLIDGDRLDLGYGAQDLSPHTDGAYTGDISGGMLAKLGCSYVLVGHSERRQGHGEGDDVVNAKVKAAYAAGLTPIVCVGEELAIRQAGDHVGHCQKQLVEALAGITAEQAASVVLAYEPIWAIGTGEVALPEHAQEVAAELRTHFAGLYGDTLAAGVRIIYGGSVKAANAAGLLDQPDVDGALVGGASLQAEEFAGIARWQSA